MERKMSGWRNVRIWQTERRKPKAMTELAYKDIKLQNDRTYRVYLYPDNSPCAVDIDQRNRRGESVPGWRTLWHHRSQYRPRPSNPALEAMESAGVSPHWLAQ
jgi:hypothetical protein